MPVLITEAGHLNSGDEREIAAFYEQAFRDWMADPRVVAVTPLFWHPDRGVYWMFDFDQNGRIVDKSPTYELIRRLPRMRGSPEYAPEIGNVARAGAQPTAQAPDAGTALRVANTDGQGVRLRAEPSRQARSLALVPDGTKVEAIGQAETHGGLTWRPVRIRSGAEGWMAAEFLTPDSAAE
jgi:hypothetical protein